MVQKAATHHLDRRGGSAPNTQLAATQGKTGGHEHLMDTRSLNGSTVFLYGNRELKAKGADVVPEAEIEIPLTYPASWENVYRGTGTVPVWHAEFPDLFRFCGGSTRLGTLDLFPQYTLMYLLRKEAGVMSVTWYRLCDTSKNSKNRDRTLAAWETMRKRMGAVAFHTLRLVLLQNGFTGFTGEPDLFCWYPHTDQWFFAEAKGNDRLTESQRQWFQVCRSVLGDSVDIRVYRLTPQLKDDA